MSTKYIGIIATIVVVSFLSSKHVEAQERSKFYSNQISVGVGLSQQVGDINSMISKSHSLSVRGSRAVSNLVSLNLGTHFSSNTGIDVFPRIDLEDFSNEINTSYNSDNPYFTAFRANVYHVEAGAQFELSNLALEKYHWLNYYAGLSVGFYTWNTKYDLLDQDGVAYNDLLHGLSFDMLDMNTHRGRVDLRNRIIEMYDGTYETSGPKRRGLFRLGDETNIQSHLSVFFGVDVRLSNRFSIGVHYDYRTSTNDLLDGFSNDANDKRTSSDRLHSLQVCFGYRFGESSPIKDVWVNPWQTLTDNLLHLSTELDSLFKDDDNDGVSNKFDLEAYSSPDCEVDNKGRNVDKNQNGVLDCLEDKNIESSDVLGHKIEQLENGLNDLAERYAAEMKRLKDSIASLQSESGDRFVEFRHVVYFDHNSAELTKDEIKELDRFLFKTGELVQLEEIKLNGFASSPGSTILNNVIVNERLKAVHSMLAENLPIENAVKSIHNGGEILSSTDYLSRKVEIIVNGQR